MPLLFLLLGPTILVFIGLYMLHSVPLTFAMFYGWLFLIPIVRKRSTRLSEFGFKIQKGNLILGLVLGMVSFGAIVIGGAVLSTLLFDADKVRRLLQVWHIDYSYTLGLVVILTLINPILEELYWRGLIVQKLGKNKGAVGTSSFFYSLYHGVVLLPLFEFPYSLLVCLPIFAAGIVWGWMASKHGSLWGSILSHAMADAGIIVLYLNYVL